MKHLQELYPEKRVERKREELDRLATSYVEKLFGYLPCLDLKKTEDRTTAENILTLASTVFSVQYRVASTIPLQGSVGQVIEPALLTDAQHGEMVALIKQYGIVIMKDEHDDTMYISHDFIQGRAMALNEVELYEIVQDIAKQYAAR